MLKAFNIRHIVLSPGSRNAPLIQSFTQDDFFCCHMIVDERNAAFYGIGLIQKYQKPVVVCCTSGSAVLDYAPAVSEAFYQQLPLVVLTADRTPEWIGQMDGQTLPQANVYGLMVKRAVNLPEVKVPVDEWYCNRMLNDALIAATAGQWGPVHINIALSEPLFDYTQKDLPEVRRVMFTPALSCIDTTPFAQMWEQYDRRLIIVGQQFSDAETVQALEYLAQKTDCVIFAEHLSNCQSPYIISNFDAVLAALNKAGSEQVKTALMPDLVLSFGGHIVSKRLKHSLREHRPAQHWHLSLSYEVVDLFQSLTQLVQTTVQPFLKDLAEKLPLSQNKVYQSYWKKVSQQIPEPDVNSAFSDLSVIQCFLHALPSDAALHLANSSIVRNAQLFSLGKALDVYCNRGTNGIESSLPSAIGYACVSSEPVYLAIGDLSFFYTVGALWNMQSMKNLRILLINNSGGGIFHLLPGLSHANSLPQVTAKHDNSAKKWAEAAGLQYLCANDSDTLKEALRVFSEPDAQRSMILEVFTDMDVNKQVFQDYYANLQVAL